MKLILFFLLACVGFHAGATNYYISAASGNDANSGTSSSSPWKSLNKLNSTTLRPGDNVYFNRGEVFYGGINVKQSGTSGSPITFGAYGSGEDPIISGFSSIHSWTSLGGNIWESSSSVSSLSRTNMVFANGRFAPMGRYPNSGWLAYQKQTVSGRSISITSSSLGAVNWTGAEVFIYANRYAFDKAFVTAQAGQLLSFTSVFNPVYDQKNPKFFIQNDPRTLDSQNEWYYNPITKRLRIYSASSPSNVQISTTDHLINVNGYSYITFDNLSLIGANENSVNLAGARYITIQNCNIDYSGKSAIEGLKGVASTGLVVQNCTINHSNNYGITLKGNFDRATIRSNKIKNTGWMPGMSGISAMGIDVQGNDATISYNTVDSSVYVGIQYLGDHTVVSNNYVTNFSLYLSDGGGIYTWNGWGGKVMSNIKITNNIVINKNTDPMDVGIYLDDWSNNIEISGNTVAGCGWGLSAGNAFDVKFLNNTSYNNDMAGLFIARRPTQPVAGKIALDNIEIMNNILFIREPITNGVGAHTMFVSDASGGSKLPTNSKFDYNYYVSPVFKKGHIYSYINSAAGDRFLSDWQAYSGQDAHSKESPKPITDVNSLRFEYNATTSDKTITLDANYIDVKGKSYNGTITLAPFTSAVLIKNGPATNKAPTASAGSDQTITLPVNSVNLSGKGTDVDGTISTYTWTKVSGPSAGTIGNPKSAATSVTQLVEGVYSFELKVIDNIGAADQDTIKITVRPSGKSTPVADAGSDQSITLPTSSTSLTGSGSVVGGTISSYSWTKISGPSNGTIVSPSASTTNVTGLVQGVYEFQLKVTDNSGSSTTSNVKVIVNASDDLLDAVNPVNTVNGLDYNYYEDVSSYRGVPEFNNLKPVKTGNVNNFDISAANRSQVFAFNFTGFIDVPSDGEYTFYCNSDDGSVLYIDGVRVVDNDGLHAAREKSGTIGLKAGKHAISVGYIQMGGGSVLNVRYSSDDISKQLIPASSLYRISSNLLPAVRPSNTVNGLDYSYYEDVSAYKGVPEFGGLKPVKTGASNNFDITLARRAQVFSFNFTGFIDVPSDGYYTFYSNSDDGSVLYIDNIRVVDNDGLHSPTEKSGTIGLKAGKHAISVGYIQMGGGSVLNISYSGAGINKQTIPTASLYRVLTSGGTRTGISMSEPATLQSVADSSLSIQSSAEGLNKIGIKAYPNPFTDHVIVSISGKAGDYKMILVDAIGRTLWVKNGTKQQGIFEQSINTSSLQRGIYFLKIIQNDNSSAIKLEK